MARSGASRSAACGSIDAVGSEVLRVLKPLGIDAAVKALEAQTSEMSAAQRQLELALQQARFSAAHARRQYDAVDPANRLVAGELERRWNEALQVVQRIEDEIAALEARKPAPLGETERQQLDAARRRSRARLVASGCDGSDAQEDLARGTARDRRAHRRRLHRDGPPLAGRRSHRAEAEDEWGRQASLDGARGYVVAGPRAGAPDARPADRAAPQSRRQADRPRQWLDQGAGLLVPQTTTALPSIAQGEWAERGEITLEAAAQIIDVSVMTALRMIRHGVIKGRQLCRGAPWVIKAEDLAAYRAQMPRGDR